LGKKLIEKTKTKKRRWRRIEKENEGKKGW